MEHYFMEPKPSIPNKITWLRTIGCPDLRPRAFTWRILLIAAISRDVNCNDVIIEY